MCFLQPLVNELKILQNDSIITYDAKRKENFQLQNSILWTVNKYPQDVDLSRWRTKGKMACFNSHTDTMIAFI